MNPGTTIVAEARKQQRFFCLPLPFTGRVLGDVLLSLPNVLEGLPSPSADVLWQDLDTPGHSVASPRIVAKLRALRHFSLCSTSFAKGNLNRTFSTRLTRHQKVSQIDLNLGQGHFCDTRGARSGVQWRQSGAWFGSDDDSGFGEHVLPQRLQGSH